MRTHEASRRVEKYSCSDEMRGPRGASGDPYDGAEFVEQTMPDACLEPPPHDPIMLIMPSTEVRTYVGLPTDFTECDMEYILSRPPPLRNFKHTLERAFQPDAMEYNTLIPWCEEYRLQRNGPADPLH